MKTKLPKLELIIQELVKNQVKSLADLDFLKRKIAKKLKIPTLSNIKLLKAYHNLIKNKRLKLDKNIEFFLIKRRIRSLSGIVNVSVLTKPYPCPGKCIYCPSEKGIPKSYVSGEPAVERAKKLIYKPRLEVQKRIEMLISEGHPTDKIELRIIGGTWSYYPKKYQYWFIKHCFQACNELKSKQLQPKKQFQENPRSRVNSPISELIRELKREQKKNEKAKHRIIGISIETRPDFITEKEIKRLRELGITRVELGVQSIYNDVLKLNKRGHKAEETIKATKLLKDAGFKVSYQMMLNLPGSSFKRDVKMFKEIFSNPDFQPDFLKIYPLALTKNTLLYKSYKQGKYLPYSKKKLVELLIEIKKQIPYYCRIQRIIRDMPSEKIVKGGAKTSNLREITQKEMKKQGIRCKCIRCREVKENYDPEEKTYLFRQNYKASGGKEIFLSYENKNRTKLYSLLRLRIPLKKTLLSALKNAAIIREIHTYGQMLSVNYRSRAPVISPQHKGLGKKLMKEAEKIAKEEFNLHLVKFPPRRNIPPEVKQFNEINKIAVISGVGVRKYYRKLGYRLKNTYMVKNLNKKRIP